MEVPRAQLEAQGNTSRKQAKKRRQVARNKSKNWTCDMWEKGVDMIGNRREPKATQKEISGTQERLWKVKPGGDDKGK